MPSAPTRSRRNHPPKQCPQCGTVLHIGVRDRHSAGPTHGARVLGSLALPAGFLVGAAGLWFTWRDGILYGAIVAVMSGVFVAIGIDRLAQAMPLAWTLRCSSCPWQAELPGQPRQRPAAK